MSTGLLVFCLWILFLAIVVGGILWVLNRFVEDGTEEECPLGKDCTFENKDEYKHTKEYYDDRDRNR